MFHRQLLTSDDYTKSPLAFNNISIVCQNVLQWYRTVSHVFFKISFKKYVWIFIATEICVPCYTSSYQFGIALLSQYSNSYLKKLNFKLSNIQKNTYNNIFFAEIHNNTRISEGRYKHIAVTSTFRSFENVKYSIHRYKHVWNINEKFTYFKIFIVF